MSENGTLLREMGKVKSAKEKVLSRVLYALACVFLFMLCMGSVHVRVGVSVSVTVYEREREKVTSCHPEKKSFYLSLRERGTENVSTWLT